MLEYNSIRLNRFLACEAMKRVDVRGFEEYRHDWDGSGNE